MGGGLGTAPSCWPRDTHLQFDPQQRAMLQRARSVRSHQQHKGGGRTPGPTFPPLPPFDSDVGDPMAAVHVKSQFTQLRASAVGVGRRD